MKQLLFLFLIFNTLVVSAQKEAYNWPFSYQRALTFHGGNINLLIDSFRLQTRGQQPSAISDCQGNLLLYTNGVDLYNGMHDTLFNSGLNVYPRISISMGQNTNNLIVRKPNTNHEFFVIGFPENPFPQIQNYNYDTLRYAHIDLSVNPPNGQIISKSTAILDSVSLHFTIIQKENMQDYWLIVPRKDHKFYAFTISDTGISQSPVISTPTYPNNNTVTLGRVNNIRPSHSGNLIALNSGNVSNSLAAIQIYNFDKSTGILTHLRELPHSVLPFFNSNYTSITFFGFEFSPNERYLYYLKDIISSYCQIDLSLPLSSRHLITCNNIYDTTSGYSLSINSFGLVQAFNRTINTSPFLNSILIPCRRRVLPSTGGPNEFQLQLVDIQKPNLPAPFNDVNYNKMSLGADLEPDYLTNFPTFPQGTIKTVTFENSCATDTIAFQLSSMATVDSVHWYFGDTASGALNFARGDSVWHKFSSPGEYHMLTIMFRKQGCIDSIRTPFTAQVPPVFSLPNDTLLCEGDTINFNLPNAAVASYFWNDSIYGPKRIFTKDGMYTLDAYNDCGDYIDSFYIAPMNIPDPQISLGGDVRICLGDTLPLNAASPLATYQWHDLSTDSIFLADGTDAQVWVEVSNICGSSRDTANVRTDLNFVDIGQDTIICLNELLPLTFPNTFNRDSLRWNSNNQLFSSLDTISVPVGTVSIEVYNACGIVRDTLQIDTLQPLPPNLQFANPYRICAATQSQIDVTWPGATYAWNTGDTTGILQNPVLANYTVTVSNSCGSQILNLNIRSHQPLQVNLVRDTLLCAGQTFFFLPGIPATQYDSMIWNGNQSANGKMVFAGDSAILAVYNTCGTYRDTGYTHILPIPQISLQADTNICDGDQVTLMLQGQVSPSDNLLWNNGSSDSSILVNQAGNYQISVSNKCGNDSAQITIGILPQPTLVLPQNLVFCQGGNVQIFNTTNPNSSILWNNQITATQYTANSGGWVFATLQDICATLQDSVFVQEDFPLQINFSNDTSLCSNESILLDATQATAEYLWQDGSAQSQFVAANPGTYWVQLSNFCNTTSDTFRITKVLEPALNIPAETILCQNESVEIDASRPENRVIWSDGSQATQRSFESNTQLSLLQFNRCGDTAQATIAVFKTELEDSLQNNNGTLICNYTAGSNYTWYFEGQEIAKNQTSFKPLYKGIYTITFTDSLGCEQILSGYAEGLEKPKCAYWNLYPNPNSGYQISVDYEASKLLKIEVYTALGQLLDVKQMPKNNNEGISTFIWEHTLPLGSYYFRASFTGDCVESRSLIVR